MTAPGPIGYRPGLDGLRAVAVIAVLGYHGDVTWMRGGFIGVDIFFVLSGFLITRLLLDEQARTRTVHFGRFYARRALRLLPALAAVLGACVVYAYGWLDPTVAARTARDAIATATYHLNWKLALGEHPPFGLLDHAWSLAIEEQFYLAWPLVAVVVLRRWGPRGVFVVATGGALAAAALRFGLSLHGTPDRRIYYGTDTHADGLLAGAALAAWSVWRCALPRQPRWAGPVALAGLGTAVVVFDLGTAGVDRAGILLVAVATMLVIVDVVRGGVLAGCLAARPLVAIGRVSYGLYLWHWPVYLVVNGDRFDLSAPILLLVRLAVTALVTTVSWLAIEQPALRVKRRFEPSTASPAPSGAAPGRARPTT